MRLAFISFALVTMASPVLAGDFCVVVCDRAEQGRRSCPAPTVRSSAQMRDDLRRFANGESVDWPTAALSNGFVSFCSPAEHRAVMASVVENIAVAPVDRRRQLVDFACMVGPSRALTAVDAAMTRPGLTRTQRERLSRARVTLRACAKPDRPRSR
jgi:hypothetical protein